MVVAIILVATRMAMSTTGLPGRSRCRPGHVAVTVLVVWLAVSWPCFAALPATNRRVSTCITMHSAPRTCMSRGDGHHHPAVLAHACPRPGGRCVLADCCIRRRCCRRCRENRRSWTESCTPTPTVSPTTSSARCYSMSMHECSVTCPSWRRGPSSSNPSVTGALVVLDAAGLQKQRARSAR